MKKLFLVLLVIYSLNGCAAKYAHQYPLHSAAYNGNTSQLQTWIKSGAPIDEVDDAGMTPFLHAVSSCDPEMATIMITNGANVNAITDDGLTALHYVVLSCSDSPEKALTLTNLKFPKKVKQPCAALLPQTNLRQKYAAPGKVY